MRTPGSGSNLKQEGTCNIYIWGSDGNPSTLREAVKRAVGSGIFSRIRHLNVGYAPEGGRRVKLVASNRDKFAIRKRIVAWSDQHKLGWRVDTLHGPTQAPKQVEAQSAPAATHSGDTKLVSWNIDGFVTKELEVTNLLTARRPDVLALQETKLRDRDRSPRLDGYRGHHGLGDNKAGRRGVSLLIREGLTTQSAGVEDNPNFIFRRIIHPGRCLVVGSIYAPCEQTGLSTKKTFLRRLGLALASIGTKYPTDALAVMGDWNMAPSGVQRWLREWQDRIP